MIKGCILPWMHMHGTVQGQYKLCCYVSTNDTVGDYTQPISSIFNNEKYKKKFGFPFIIAVKGKNKEEILNSFRQRITNNINLEFEEAKKQVKKIASFRLNEISSK